MRISQKLMGRTPYDPSGKPCPVVLNANESFLPPSDAVMAAFQKIVAELDFNRYPDPRARALCESFATYYNTDPDLVTAGNGSDEIIDLLFSCLVAPGDRVLTMAPDFTMYAHGAMMHGVTNLYYEKDSDYNIHVDAVLTQAQDSDVAMVLFSNPCNPTGVVLPRTDVVRLIEGFDGIVVVDEAYMDFSNQSVLDLVSQYDNLVVLKTCSKAVAMASLRLGFAVASPLITRILQTGKAPYNVGRLVQAMGACVLSRPEELQAAITTILASRDALLAGVQDLVARHSHLRRVLPTATNYMLIETLQAEVVYLALQDEGVLVRLSGPQWLRVCAGTDEENAAFLEALDKVLLRLEEAV